MRKKWCSEVILKYKLMLMRLPSFLLILGSFIASIYAKVSGMYDLSYFSIIILGICATLFVIAEYLSIKEIKNINQYKIS
jgi:hypothetical protein